MRPVIGIVMCGSENGRQFVSQPYLDAVTDAGGLPTVLPVTGDTSLYAGFSRLCDGFLFCGGGDITPLLFGEELLTDQGGTDLFTDRFHLSLMAYVLQSRLPVLAICRGMQVMNLALGGTIWQDLSLRPVHTLNHMQVSAHRQDVCHKITISKNSMLYDFLGEYAEVNSFHHQCLHLIPASLRPSAIASDGVVEAIELPGHPFALGVQWHPEVLYPSDHGMKKLFLALLKKASVSKNIQYISPFSGAE